MNKWRLNSDTSDVFANVHLCHLTAIGRCYYRKVIGNVSQQRLTIDASPAYTFTLPTSDNFYRFTQPSHM